MKPPSIAWQPEEELLQNLKRLRLVKILALSCYLFKCSLGAFALSSPTLVAEEATKTLEELSKNYVLVTTQSNYPIAKSLSFLRSAKMSKGLQYMHTLDRDWVMAVGAQFKNFSSSQNQSLRTMFTGYHETLALTRIYYPTYFLFGAQAMYILPSLSNTIPPKRDPMLDAEVGFGLCAYLFSQLGKNYSTFFKVSRWRGTKTTKLQAFEISVGLGGKI